jgi:hypothetical protein
MVIMNGLFITMNMKVMAVDMERFLNDIERSYPNAQTPRRLKKEIK